MTMNDNDEDLYEKYVQESRVRRAREEAQETQQTQEELQQDLQSTLNEILREIEEEVQRNRQRRRSRRRSVQIRGGNDRVHIIGRLDRQGNDGGARDQVEIEQELQDRQPFSMRQRRPFIRVLLRNILVLDYFILLMLVPFSLYNMLRTGFSTMTFSEQDVLSEVALYWNYLPVFHIDESTGAKAIVVYKDSKFGLLGKFHNIVVYYSTPVIKWVARCQQTPWPDWICRAYQAWVKLTTTAIYLSYGIGGSIYVFAAGLFFMLCLALTIVRKYKGVHQMLRTGLESSTRIPGVF